MINVLFKVLTFIQIIYLVYQNLITLWYYIWIMIIPINDEIQKIHFVYWTNTILTIILLTRTWISYITFFLMWQFCYLIKWKCFWLPFSFVFCLISIFLFFFSICSVLHSYWQLLCSWCIIQWTRRNWYKHIWSDVSNRQDMLYLQI